jgi:uncharacterized protein (TIGR00369 family)
MPSETPNSAQASGASQDRHTRALNFMFSKVEIVRALGIELLTWDENTVRTRMPYTALADNGSRTPLGGATATLVDITGAAAVWAGHDFSNGSRHATVGMSINYLSASREEAQVATATCIRRGKDLNFVNVEVHTEESARLTTSAMMTFRIVH